MPACAAPERAVGRHQVLRARGPRRRALRTAGIARLQELLVEIAAYKERQRAWLKHAEDEAEAARQAYRRRLDAILTAMREERVPEPLLRGLHSEETLYLFSPAEIELLERLRDWGEGKGKRRRR